MANILTDSVGFWMEKKRASSSSKINNLARLKCRADLSKKRRISGKDYGNKEDLLFALFWIDPSQSQMQTPHARTQTHKHTHTHAYQYLQKMYSVSMYIDIWAWVVLKDTQ